MKFKEKKTDRGFKYIESKDKYDEIFSIQESSSASRDRVWVGCDEVSYDMSGQPFNTRMHLDRKGALELASILAYFGNTGDLPEVRRGKLGTVVLQNNMEIFTPFDFKVKKCKKIKKKV